MAFLERDADSGRRATAGRRAGAPCSSRAPELPAELPLRAAEARALPRQPSSREHAVRRPAQPPDLAPAPEAGDRRPRGILLARARGADERFRPPARAGHRCAAHLRSDRRAELRHGVHVGRAQRAGLRSALRGEGDRQSPRGRYAEPDGLDDDDFLAAARRAARAAASEAVAEDDDRPGGARGADGRRRRQIAPTRRARRRARRRGRLRGVPDPARPDRAGDAEIAARPQTTDRAASVTEPNPPRAEPASESEPQTALPAAEADAEPETTQATAPRRNLAPAAAPEAAEEIAAAADARRTIPPDPLRAMSPSPVRRARCRPRPARTAAAAPEPDAAAVCHRNRTPRSATPRRSHRRISPPSVLRPATRCRGRAACAADVDRPASDCATRRWPAIRSPPSKSPRAMPRAGASRRT